MSDGMRFIEMLAAADIGAQQPGLSAGWPAMMVILVLVIIPAVFFRREIMDFILDLAKEFVPFCPVPAAATVRIQFAGLELDPVVLERLRTEVPGGPPTPAVPPVDLKKISVKLPIDPSAEKKEKVRRQNCLRPGMHKENGEPGKKNPPMPEKRDEKPPDPVQPEPDYTADETPDAAGVYVMALAELDFEIEQLYLKNMLPPRQKYDIHSGNINVFFLQAAQQVSQHQDATAFDMLTALLEYIRQSPAPDRISFQMRAYLPPLPGPWQRMASTTSRIRCRTMAVKAHSLRAEAAFNLNFKDCAIKEWNMAEIMEEREEQLARMVTGYPGRGVEETR